MEYLFQLLDEVEDFIITTHFKLTRSLAWKSRERRRVPRTSPATLTIDPTAARSADGPVLAR